MKVKILGLKDESYNSKTNNSLVNQVRVCFSREGVEGVIGSFCDNLLITERHCPSAVELLQQMGDSALGKVAFISKDTSEFNGKSYSFVDYFEFLPDSDCEKGTPPVAASPTSAKKGA